MVHNPVVKRNDADETQSAANEPKTAREPRIGVAKGEFVVPDSFFDPLPDEILDGFSGENPV